MISKWLLTFLLAASLLRGQAQDSIAVFTKSRRANVEIQTFDGNRIRARIVDIAGDYLLIDAKPFNKRVALAPYYVRSEGEYFKIDVQYIKAVSLSSRRHPAKMAFTSAGAGGLLVVVVLAKNISEIEKFSTVYKATGAGVIAGGFLGFCSEVFRGKKKIEVSGATSKLTEISNYLLTVK